VTQVGADKQDKTTMSVLFLCFLSIIVVRDSELPMITGNTVDVDIQYDML